MFLALPHGLVAQSLKGWALVNRRVPCEMCGRAGETRRVLIDKTAMNVCADCAKFGTQTGPSGGGADDVAPNVAEGLERRKRRMGTRKDVFSSETMALELVDDFGDRIQAARQKKGWTREDLGSRIRQPVNVVGQYEAGTLNPPDDVAKRIETTLGITILEKVSGDLPARRGGGGRGLTLGDMLKGAMKPDEEK